jgi:hypothetical protein
MPTSMVGMITLSIMVPPSGPAPSLRLRRASVIRTAGWTGPEEAQTPGMGAKKQNIIQPYSFFW